MSTNGKVPVAHASAQHSAGMPIPIDPALTQEDPGTPALPPHLTKEEVYALENSFLKAENLRLQGERLRQDLILAGTQFQKQQEDLRDMRLALGRKYGCNLDLFDIGIDGALRPRQQMPQQMAPGRA